MHTCKRTCSHTHAQQSHACVLTIDLPRRPRQAEMGMDALQSVRIGGIVNASLDLRDANSRYYAEYNKGGAVSWSRLSPDASGPNNSESIPKPHCTALLCCSFTMDGCCTCLCLCMRASHSTTLIVHLSPAETDSVGPPEQGLSSWASIMVQPCAGGCSERSSCRPRAHACLQRLWVRS
jgi:hypothetical protein